MMALESRLLLESSLHQQRRIHLHHSPLRRQHRGPTPLEFASPPTDIDEFVDAFHDSEEVRFRRVDNLVSEGGAPGLAWRLMDDPELLLVSIEEPPTFIVAEHDVNWHRTMLEEMKAIEDMGAGGSIGGL